jgi:hypothetical protein
MTKSRRGAANIQAFNTERAQRNVSLIAEELKKSKRRKLEFRSIGRLAEYVASTTGIHRTTLLRNNTYKALLVSHLASKGVATTSVSDEEAPVEILRAKLMGVRLELSNLKDKYRRLEAYISKLGTAPTLADEATDAGTEDYYIQFVDTSMALAAVLERLRDTTLLNTAAKTIEDLAAPPSQRTIVGPERATAFINWFQQQEAIKFRAKN